MATQLDADDDLKRPVILRASHGRRNYRYLCNTKFKTSNFQLNISGLGGGGLATPQISNIFNAINYALLATSMYYDRFLRSFVTFKANRTFPVCFMGGPIVNKLGVKWALVLGAMTFPIQGSAYYCNSKFGNQWVSGVCNDRERA